MAFHDTSELPGVLRLSAVCGFIRTPRTPATARLHLPPLLLSFNGTAHHEDLLHSVAILAARLKSPAQFVEETSLKVEAEARALRTAMIQRIGRLQERNDGIAQRLSPLPLHRSLEVASEAMSVLAPSRSNRGRAPTRMCAQGPRRSCFREQMPHILQSICHNLYTIELNLQRV